MILAIFAILLLLNRQTGGFFEGLFIYILPIPMVIYSAKFDVKSGLMVFAGMCAFALFFGTLTSIFYGVTSALLGLIFGMCLHKKVDPTLTMFIVMGMSGAFMLVSNLALASVFGINLAEDIELMKTSMTEAFTKANIDVTQDAFKLLFSDDSLLQMMVYGMILAGLVDGFIVYRLSIMILSRLRFPLQKARPIAELYPPKWTGVLALAAYFYGSIAFRDPDATQLARNVSMSCWIGAYLYLVVFGIIAFALFLSRRLRLNKIAVVLLCLLGTFVLPQILVILGFMYITLSLHDQLIQQPAGR